jgi:hypothetical protein
LCQASVLYLQQGEFQKHQLLVNAQNSELRCKCFHFEQRTRWCSGKENRYKKYLKKLTLFHISKIYLQKLLSKQTSKQMKQMPLSRTWNFVDYLELQHLLNSRKCFCPWQHETVASKRTDSKLMVANYFTATTLPLT